MSLKDYLLIAFVVLFTPVGIAILYYSKHPSAFSQFLSSCKKRKDSFLYKFRNFNMRRFWKTVGKIIFAFSSVCILLWVSETNVFSLFAPSPTESPRPTTPYVPVYTEEELAKKALYDEAYSAGYNKGYSEGVDSGIDEGYEYGFDEGYNNGYHTGFTESRAQVLDVLAGPLFNDYGLELGEYFDMLPYEP